MKTIKNVLLTSMTCLFLTSCGSDKPAAEAFGLDFSKVQNLSGPEVTGQWNSSCIESAWGNNSYRIIKISSENSNMNYETRSFKDEDCLRENYRDKKSFKGTFSYKKNIGAGVYEVEMKLPTRNPNIFALRSFNLRKNDHSLTISEFYFTNNPSEQEVKIELQKEASTNLPSDGILTSGRYEDDSAHYCDMSVSTMVSNNQVKQIYIDLLSGCKGKIQLNCKDNTCTDSKRSLVILSENSYEYTGTRGVKKIFIKK